MQSKTLPFMAAALLLGSVSIASAQQSNTPAVTQPQPTDEQMLVNPGRQQQPLRSGSQQQPLPSAGQVQGQMPSGTTGSGAMDQGSQDRGATGFQNEPDHSRSTANE